MPKKPADPPKTMSNTLVKGNVTSTQATAWTGVLSQLRTKSDNGWMRKRQQGRNPLLHQSLGDVGINRNAHTVLAGIELIQKLKKGQYGVPVNFGRSSREMWRHVLADWVQQSPVRSPEAGVMEVLQKNSVHANSK